jgi:penicillin amidase
VRRLLVSWDREVGLDDVAALYVTWEQTLRRMLIERRVPAELRSEATARLADIVSPLLRPTNAWFDGDTTKARDALLVEALTAVVKEVGEDRQARAWGRTHVVTFAHPLAVTDRARERFNVGPFPIPGYPETILAASAAIGPSLRVVFDVSNWDRSVATNAPGQSGSPASAHFADLAALWARGEYFSLPFSTDAVRSSAESTLTLVPQL